MYHKHYIKNNHGFARLLTWKWQTSILISASRDFYTTQIKYTLRIKIIPFNIYFIWLSTKSQKYHDDSVRVYIIPYDNNNVYLSIDFSHTNNISISYMLYAKIEWEDSLCMDVFHWRVRDQMSHFNKRP